MSESEQAKREAERLGGAATAGPAAAVTAPRPRSERWRPFLMSLLFLAPALVLLGFLVIYPIFYSVYRSFYDKAGTNFVGVQNYHRMFTNPGTLTAIRNNAIWLIGPAIVTAIALVLAVLAERIRWSTAFKVVMFMPMAISALAAGVLWRGGVEAGSPHGTGQGAIPPGGGGVPPAGGDPGPGAREGPGSRAAGGAVVG